MAAIGTFLVTPPVPDSASNFPADAASRRSTSSSTDFIYGYRWNDADLTSGSFFPKYDRTTCTFLSGNCRDATSRATCAKSRTLDGSWGVLSPRRAHEG
jgi:hypothetical protein